MKIRYIYPIPDQGDGAGKDDYCDLDDYDMVIIGVLSRW